MKKIILNPNCSEIIMRLDISKKNVLKRLEKIGIKEIEFNEIDIYDWGKTEDKTKEIADKNNPNIPDFNNLAHIQIHEGEWNTPEEKGIEKTKSYVYAHQHCQHQMFPTLKKIEDELQGDLLDEPFSSGGSIENYEDWKDKEEKIPNYQDDKSRKKRNKLVMIHFLKGKCSICGFKIKEKIETLSEKGWKICMNCNKECCPECVKKGKLEENYFFCSQKCMNKIVADKL